MRKFWHSVIVLMIGLVILSLGSGLAAQDSTPTASPSPTTSPTSTPTPNTTDEEEEIRLSEVVVSTDGTLAVYYPEGWGGAATSDGADLALANDPELVPQVGSAVPEAGQIMIQINSIARDQLTPVGGLFDLALILDQLTASFTTEDGTNPFDNDDTAIINGGPALTTRATVSLFDVPVDAYLVVIDRQAESRVLIFIMLAAQGELDDSIDLLDRMVRQTQLRFPVTVFSESITSLDGVITVQTPQDWYARSVIGSGIVLSPSVAGVQIEDLLRLEPGQVVIQVSGGTREAVFADHSRSVRDLAGWTLLNYRQPIDNVTMVEVDGRPAAQIQFIFGEGEGQVELYYLFVEFDEQDSVVWFSIVTPPGEASQYVPLVETLVNTLQIHDISH